MSEVDAVLAGDRRAAARLMTRAETGDATIEPILQRLFRAGGDARVVGVTGPPGAGKSTLVDAMVARYRQAGKRVAVLAVDPTSAVSGGAVLGDRVRMARHAEDQGVFIRSMATRGALGGLALAAGDVLTVLDAMRFDVVIVETVGVGQSEIDILHHADTVVLLQTALSGDALQTIKAGVLEIADIIVVNKAHTPGSDKMAQTLARTIGERAHTAENWAPPVLLTDAVDGTGVAALMEALDRFADHQSAHHDARELRLRRRVQTRIMAIVNARAHRAVTRVAHPDELSAAIGEVARRFSDPHSLAEQLLIETSRSA